MVTTLYKNGQKGADYVLVDAGSEADKIWRGKGYSESRAAKAQPVPAPQVDININVEATNLERDDLPAEAKPVAPKVTPPKASKK